MSDARLGVFICDCGGEISSVLDTACLETCARELPGVALAQRLNYSCSPDGIEAITAACTEQGLDRVVVAGCTPRLMSRHLQRSLPVAGDLIELADIREGCAWVHQDEPGLATAKAFDAIRMGAARVALRQARRPISGEVVPGALVIGGGVAGMTAALTLANAGQPVKLVERAGRLGGMMADVHSSTPDRRDGRGLAQQIETVSHHPAIEVLLNSQVTEVSGTVGRYSVRLNSNGQRLDAGAIVVATGAHQAQPWGQYRYDGHRVVTQSEFESELATGTAPDSVAMILCAGQRNEAVPYCSGVCCVGALRQALAVKAANPQASVTVLFRDLCLQSDRDGEKLLLAARQAGVQFMRYDPASPPQVSAEGVDVCDASTGRSCRLPYDRVVLATPLAPQPDAGVLAHLLGIAQDEHGFFPAQRHRLRPEGYAERGIYICGAAHQPAGRVEAEIQAISAAFKALRHLRAGQVVNGAPVASVDPALCTGCANCVEPCPFDAIAMHLRRAEAVDLAQIEPLLCTGCGNCVVVCPVKAISQAVDSDAQVLAQIEAALRTVDGGSADRRVTSTNGAGGERVRILVFGCEWSGHAAAELAGANKLSYPVETRLIRLRCSARFDPIHILWALFNGADGVFLGVCGPGDCHYIDGNRYAQERITTLRGLLAANGFDSRRLRLEWITPDDPHDFVTKVSGFTELVSKL